MNTKKTIKFSFENIKFLEPIKEDWQVLLRIESDFKIYVTESVLYQENYFNVVEFAHSISRWLIEAKSMPKDYYYETMDSDEVGFVWIKQKKDKYQIGSIYQEFEENHFFTYSEIEESANAFIKELILNLPIQVSNKVKKMISYD